MWRLPEIISQTVAHGNQIIFDGTERCGSKGIQLEKKFRNRELKLDYYE